MDLRRIILCVLLAFIILLALDEAEARGIRTSRRTPVRNSSRRKDKTKTKSKPKAKVVKPKTFHSSVQRGEITKQKPFNKRFLVHAAVTYTLLNAVIYSRRYRPYHDTSNIEIPEDRALRMSEERYHLQTRNGSQCGGNSSRLLQYNKTDVLKVTTKITYKKHVTGYLKTIQPVETSDPKQTTLTVSAEATNDYVVHFEILVTFKNGILANSTLTTTAASPLSSTQPTNTTSSSNSTLSTNSSSSFPRNITRDPMDCAVLVYKAEAYVVEYSFAFKTKESFLLILSAMFLSFLAIN